MAALKPLPKMVVFDTAAHPTRNKAVGNVKNPLQNRSGFGAFLIP